MTWTTATTDEARSEATMEGTTAPAVPGYLLERVLGIGAGGPVWLARRAAGSQEPVALKVVAAGDGAGRELAVLAAVRHPHVLAVRDTVVLDDERLVLAFDVAEGGTLRSLVSARGHLAPGEVVTVLSPLAQTLADLHAQGIEHGDVSPGNVLLDGSGRPLLGDLGTVRVTGVPRDEVFGTAGYVDPVVLAGGLGDPSSDVYGLGAVGWFALVGSPPPSTPLRPPLADLVPDVPLALVALIEAAVDPDPTRRPLPLDLARALHDAAVAIPVWRRGSRPDEGGLTHRIRGLAAASAGDGSTGPARHRAVRRRRFRVVGAAFVALALVLAGGAGWQLTRAAAGAAPVRPSGGSAVSDPVVIGSVENATAVLRELSDRRAAAFAGPGAGGLEAVVRPGSSAAAADGAAIRALIGRGLAYRNLRLTPRAVRVVTAGGVRAVVVASTDASAYDVVDASGRVVARMAAVPGRPTRFELERTTQGWRVSAVT